MVLEASKVLDAGDLTKILPLVAGPSNKYGETRIFPSSAVVERSVGSVQPVFLHSIVTGLVPPFPTFSWPYSPTTTSTFSTSSRTLS